MSYCQCEFTRNPRAEPRQRRVGRRRGGRGRKSEVQVGVGLRPVEAQCEIKKSHPLPGETSVLETTPKQLPPNLTNLGRAPDETVMLHTAKYRSRTLRVTTKRLSNVQGQT